MKIVKIVKLTPANRLALVIGWIVMLVAGWSVAIIVVGPLLVWAALWLVGGLSFGGPYVMEWLHKVWVALFSWLPPPPPVL